jgi:hypothetical protein
VIDTVGVRIDRPHAMIDLFATPRGSLAAAERSSTARCRCPAGNESCSAWTRRARCSTW